MRLKEIKPGMNVHCGTKEEARNLIEEAYKQGYEWNGNGNVDDTFWLYYEDTCYRFDDDIKITYGGLGYFANEYGANAIIEFSDLIIPDMSAEEAFKILGDIRNCNESTMCSECPLGSKKNAGGTLCSDNSGVNIYNPDRLIEICQQWKSEKEKKEPEIETVDICRIIEIQQNGYKKCVHEEDIETELPFGGDEREKVEETLKRYCMEHEGNFIAVHEVVSRVKAVE